MKPGESREDFLLTEPSGVGLLLLDALTLRPLHVNREAIGILAYPDTPCNVKSFGESVIRKIQSLVEKRTVAPDGAFVSEFVSGRRTYRCRAFSLDRDPPASDSVVALLVERRPHLTLNVQRIAEKFSLTQRELETMEYLVQGYTSKEIADRMKISPNTVKAFIRLIMMKTGTSTRSGIVGKILPVKIPPVKVY
jgi:DNA-binding CsgD family transcriptional regulator